jgi:hypothetical protein
MSAEPTAIHALVEKWLMLATPSGGLDSILWDRAKRLSATIPSLLRQPEMQSVACDRRGAEMAALFFEVGRARSVTEGRLTRDNALLEPYDDACREAAIDALKSAASDDGPLSAASRDAAVAALRQWNWAENASAEAVLLSEAVHLDDLGPMWIWHHARLSAATGDSVFALLSQWHVRQEYGYWESRIKKSLRFEWSRQIARRRVAAMQVFIETIEQQVRG